MIHKRPIRLSAWTLLFATLACSTARADSELVWRDLRLRLVRVNENTPDNPRDDSAEFIVRTATTSTNMTITEYRSEFVDEYEIYLIYARPDPGKPGGGTARVTVYGR